MKTNDYLYAVAAIRANEVNLLKEADMEQLINAPDYRKAVTLLADKGYNLPDGSDYSAMLDSEIGKTWELINKSAPEADALKTFVVANDFQNLKAILKAEVTAQNAADYFVSPSVADAQAMLDAVSERRFDDLPEFIAPTAKKAFDELTKTGNGQLCDIIVDADALNAIIFFAKESGDETLIDYADGFVTAAAVKTSLRAIRTKKSRTFLEMAVPECDAYDKQRLIDSAIDGEAAFADYLTASGLGTFRAAFEKGSSAFEKFCDDKIIDIMKQAKMTAFGISPLAAYFVAKQTEVKCLRIILSGKISGVSNEVIRERMRELYV